MTFLQGLVGTGSLSVDNGSTQGEGKQSAFGGKPRRTTVLHRQVLLSGGLLQAVR
ncbi:MAG: hypothetical protein AB8B99_18420 [Phormidesmis sp.]